jgi:hypothetical protein
MKKIDLQLEFNRIRERIEIDKSNHKPGKWAEPIGVSKTLVSNIHGRSKRQNPSLPYVFAVSMFTGKPIEWYLYGGELESKTVAETQQSYGAGQGAFGQEWSEEIKELCKKVKDIVESEHHIIVPVLVNSIEACCKQLDEIKKLKEIATHRKKLLESDTENGTGKAASTGSRKKKT